MTISHTAIWRARPSGSLLNGGGYDPAVSGTLSTTLNGAYTASSGTITLTSASGFPTVPFYFCVAAGERETYSSGATGSAMMFHATGGTGPTYTGTGGALGTTDQNFASGALVTNELNRCDTAVASGSVATSTASTTISGLTGADATWVGNALWLASGTGSPTVGPYFIQSVTNSTTVVVDRASGTYTAGVWKLGGGWTGNVPANMSTTWILPGHKIYFRGSGSGSVGSPDYSWTNYINAISGDTTNGPIRFIGENTAPPSKSHTSFAFIGTNQGLMWYQCNQPSLEGLYIFATADIFGGLFLSGTGYVQDCVLDQNGLNVGVGPPAGYIINCEVFSSTPNSGGQTLSSYALGSGSPSLRIAGCNVHDTFNSGIQMAAGLSTVENCIVAHCNGHGISLEGAADGQSSVSFCIIDSNKGDGIRLEDNGTVGTASVFSNIISNHTTAGTYGLNCPSGTTQAVNDRLRAFFDYNTYYNNTTNANAITIGTGVVNGQQLHDNVGVNPGFTSAANQNYTPGTAVAGLALPSTTAFWNSLAGKGGSANSNYPGAVQPAASGGGGTQQVAVGLLV